MVDVTIEDTDGAELARVQAESVPRTGDHVRTMDGVYYVDAVVWDLTDGPLTAARVIVENRK